MNEICIEQINESNNQIIKSQQIGESQLLHQSIKVYCQQTLNKSIYLSIYQSIYLLLQITSFLGQDAASFIQYHKQLSQIKTKKKKTTKRIFSSSVLKLQEQQLIEQQKNITIAYWITLLNFTLGLVRQMSRTSTGFYPWNNRTANTLLLKDDVGRAKPSAYSLPPVEYTYGRPLERDEEGAKEGNTYYANIFGDQKEIFWFN